MVHQMWQWKNNVASHIIELEDGKILTGLSPILFDGNFTHGFPVKIFPNKPIP